jgi:hypothetical protein
MAPRVSILMPTHNRADVLPFAIRAVLAQTELDFEILIVGDGCTDNTADVVSQFIDPRIKWFDLPKAPYFGYANRNIALKEARGAFIAYAAHDDLMFPDHLSSLVGQLEATGAELTYSRPLVAAPNGTVVPLSGNLNNPDELENFLHRDNFIPTCCFLHRRECLAKYGYWPEDVTIGADWHLWRRIISGGGAKNFEYHPASTTLHFKAKWRESLDPALTALLAIANDAVWWPAALKLSVDSCDTEQAAFSRILEKRSSAWIDEVRQAVSMVIEKLAWEHTLNCLHDPDHISGRAPSLLALLTNEAARSTGLAEVLKGVIDRELAMPESEFLFPPAEFVEQSYLDANPDVAEAVRNRNVSSGWEHWITVGWSENRRLRPM